VKQNKSLIKKIESSLAFRIRPILKELCFLGIYWKKSLSKKETLSVKLVSMVGADQIPMLQQCLISIFCKWDKVPEKIIIVSDGSVNETCIKKRFNFLPAQVHIKMPEDYLSSFSGSLINEYAGRNPFGLKLAILLKENEIGRTLWCDSDILFFGDLSQAIQNLPAGPIFVAGVDWIHGYEPQLRNFLGGQWMPDKPVNAGFILFEAVPFVMSEIQAGLDFSRKSWNWATEQTLVAYFHAKMGGLYWDECQMVITEEDLYEIRGDPWSKGWMARHYIKPHRPMFWRDVYLLKKQGKNRKGA